MKNDYKNIEELFRNSLDAYKVEPSKDFWKKINSRLNIKDFISPNFKIFNLYYLSAIIGIISGLFLLQSEDAPLINKISNKKENIVQIEKLDIPNDKKEEIANRPKKKKAIVSYLTEVYTQKDFKIAIERQKSNILPLTLKNNLKEFSKIYGESLNIDSITVLPPKPLFILENKKGCVPFEINPNNQTQGAQYFEWTFGDGSKSSNPNPSFTYQYPGIYTIKLKAIGAGGIAYCIIDSVVVYDSAKNKVNWPYQKDILEGERIELTPELQNCSRYEWNFGDGTISTLKKPGHIYQNAGKYSIVLKSWSDKNCIDSADVAKVNIVKLESLIAYPNAFRPNPNGPSGGKYAEKEIHNDIFHPVVNEEIAEYNFKIFSKEGVLIFESKDIQIGWDGYYHNQMMAEGVYPYIAIGKFEGGRKFIKKGNLTLLHIQ